MTDRLIHCTNLWGGHHTLCDRDGTFCALASTHDGPCMPHLSKANADKAAAKIEDARITGLMRETYPGLVERFEPRMEPASAFEQEDPASHADEDVLDAVVRRIGYDDYNKVPVEELRRRLKALRGTRSETALEEAVDVLELAVRDVLYTPEEQQAYGDDDSEVTE